MPYRHAATRRKYQREYARRKRAEKVAERKKSEPAPAEPEVIADPIEWIEETLTVPSGPLRGQPFRLGEWQRSFIREALADGIREALLCVARKNGKTQTVAALLLCFMVGPLSRPDWRGYAVSLNGRFSVLLRDAVEHTAKASGIEGIRVYRTPYPGYIKATTGAQVEFLSADKASGNGIGGDVVVVDECGLMDESQRGLWNNMLSSTSGRDGRLIAISVRGSSPMTEELIARRDDPGVLVHLYECAETDSPSDPASWAKGNPGLADGIKSVDYMQHAASRAERSPSDMQHFRVYELNQKGAPDRQLLVPMADWIACTTGAPRQPRDVCFVGFDAGAAASMTACAAWYPESQLLRTWAALPGIPDVDRRGESDGVGDRYRRMMDRGELLIYENVRTTPLSPFLRFIAEELDGHNVICITADRYRESEVQDACQSAGITWPRIFRGTGWRDGSHDCRAFQRAVVGRQLWHAESLLMESALLETAVAMDAGGNLKLDKARSRGRIDAVSASVIALGEAERWAASRAKRKPARYLGAV